MANGVREMRFLLAGPEGRILRALAARVPRSIRSNHLTAIGTIAAAAAGIAYALTTYHPAWLWVASAMLVVNWLGDSLDGTLARVRGTQRPKYGYYLDHVVDAFSTVVIGLAGRQLDARNNPGLHGRAVRRSLRPQSVPSREARATAVSLVGNGRGRNRLVPRCDDSSPPN